jgi:hypothetical protein
MTAKQRRDGFGEERKRLFLTALKRGETVLGACALVGVSNRTAYNHQERDPDFAREWDLAVRSSRLPLELDVYRRAVEGVEEPVYRYGKLSHRRVTRSDRLLMRLLEADQPEKYGRGAAARAQRERLEKRFDKRLARALAPLREALEALQPPRDSDPANVNFVNGAEAPCEAAPTGTGRGKRRTGRRFASAQRRREETEISPFSSSS